VSSLKSDTRNIIAVKTLSCRESWQVPILLLFGHILDGEKSFDCGENIGGVMV
jgi:hypothetical protein